MAKRAARSAPAADPGRLTRSQIARELGRIGDKYTIAEVARRTHTPASTLRGWIRQGRVSKRGLERSRSVLRTARKIRRKSKKRKTPPVGGRRNAASAVHLAFATGSEPILAGSGLTPNSFAKIAIAIAKGGSLPRAPTITGQRQNGIRESAFQANDDSGTAAQVDGSDYRARFEPTDAGQMELSDAWLAELRWVLERMEWRPNFFAPYDDEIVAGYNQRHQATFLTGDATTMWQFAAKTQGIPADYAGVTYELLGADEYEVKLWVKAAERASRRKRKDTRKGDRHKK